MDGFRIFRRHGDLQNMLGHLRALSKSSGKRYRAGSGSCLDRSKAQDNKCNIQRLIWDILTTADRDYNVGAHLRPSKEEKGSDVSGTMAVIPQGRYSRSNAESNIADWKEKLASYFSKCNQRNCYAFQSSCQELHVGVVQSITSESIRVSPAAAETQEELE
jgi:hypothetical protein